LAPPQGPFPGFSPIGFRRSSHHQLTGQQSGVVFHLQDYFCQKRAGCPPTVPLAAPTVNTGTADRYCGTQLVCVKTDQTANTAPATAVNTVCTMLRPFRIDVFTDIWEAALAAAAEGGGTAATEQVGFKMEYWQTADCIPVVQHV